MSDDSYIKRLPLACVCGFVLPRPCSRADFDCLGGTAGYTHIRYTWVGFLGRISSSACLSLKMFIFIRQAFIRRCADVLMKFSLKNYIKIHSGGSKRRNDINNIRHRGNEAKKKRKKGKRGSRLCMIWRRRLCYFYKPHGWR